MKEALNCGVPFRLLVAHDSPEIRNYGVPAKKNYLIKMALQDPEMKYTALLANDVQIEKNWFRTLIHILSGKPEYGAIRPLEFGDKDERGWKCMLPGGTTWLYQDNPRCVFEGIKVPQMTHRMVVVKREVWEKVGLFDENFKLGSYEGDDIGLRMLKAGYWNILTGAIHFTHPREGNTDRMGGEYYPAHVEGGAYLDQKWGGPFASVLARELEKHA